ncbi:SMP-30/gluconolactonase/LRE family protein [Roseibium aggregatum]|uniref:SMP-30/gluconolactonase/LRE family protein n=1 Tax=Roseibium aggregatum TaxID=187304 RepID=UPI0025AB83F9|nr:SMP-30/gluconolactonase/LRE family protein [Roseibium aggregatum]WJS06009.1 SMP-30/gluconolactonase/LRE family protein [Roseibium aggregatum]
MVRRSVQKIEAAGEESATQPGMQALTRGLRVLDFIAEASTPVRFMTLLDGTGFPKGTLHRLLQTLIDERYLILDEWNQTYRLGSRPFQLAHRAWDQFDLRGAALPELERLTSLANEATRLGRLDGNKVLYIDQRDPEQQVRISNGIGARSAIHATALGKAMAAHLSHSERYRLVMDGELEAFTDQTIVSNGDLDQQLNIIKARGYAVSIGEQFEDISAVAAPILDHRARPIGAIGVVGPSYRLSTERLHTLGREVIEAARRISGNVGELAMSISVAPKPLGAVQDNVSCAIPGEDFLGEGPFWSPETGKLHWVDILAPAVVTGDPATGERSTRPLPELVGVAIPKKSGGFVCATENGIKTISSNGQIETLAEPEKDHTGNRFNDGKCDAKGRLWVGSLAITTEPGKGMLWRVEPNGAAVKMDENFHVSNGLGWSPDNKTFYFTDSGCRTIWAYDFDLEEGAISNRRAFVEVAEGDGVPDGLCVDEDGYLWVAMWDGWCIRQYAPDGTLASSFPVPVPRPTSCAFGGEDMSTLYVTTARIRLSAQQLVEAPLSGCVLAIETNAKGLAGNIFAG